MACTAIYWQQLAKIKMRAGSPWALGSEGLKRSKTGTLLRPGGHPRYVLLSDPASHSDSRLIKLH